VGLIRDGPQLEQAINQIEYIKKVELPKLRVATKSQQYNLELLEAIQTKNMLEYLEVIARSALLRTESRGTQFRTDYPIEDNDNLRVNIVVRRVRGGKKVLELFKRPSVVIHHPGSTT